MLYSYFWFLVATVSKDGTRSMRLWINLPPSDASPSSGLIKNSPLSVSCTPGIISSEGMMKNGESTSTAKCPDTSKNAYTPQQIEKINKLGHKLLFLLELEEKETKADPLQLDDPKEKKEKEKENFRFGFHHPASTAGLGSAKLPSLFFCIDNNVSAAPDSIASRLPSSSGSGRW